MASAQDTDVDQETQDQGTEDQGGFQSPFQPAGNSVIHWQDAPPADDSGQAAQLDQPEEPEEPEQFQPAGKSVIRWHQPPPPPQPADQAQQQPADLTEAQPSSQLAQMFPSIYGPQPAEEPTEQRPPKAQPVPGGPVPRARPAAQQGSGLYDFEDPQDFVTGKATMFGDQGDIDRYHAAKAQGASDSEAFEVGDNGIGSPALGGLPTTDLYGAAVPAWVLRSRLGNSPAAWRKARLDIVDPSSGNRLRVPIVDIGPSASQEEKGIVADFTPGVDKYFNNQGGGKNLMFRLVKNAGPDVNSDTPDWNNEQAAIASGVDVGQTARGAQTYPARTRGRGGGAAAPTTVPWTVNWITDEEVAEARRQTQQDKLQALPDEMVALNNLQQQNQNPAAMMKALQQPIKGVSDDTRQDYAANYKQQVTKEAQQFYNEPDPDKAFARATSGAGPVEFAQQFGRQFFAKAGNLDLELNKFFANTDDAQVNNFVNQLQPDAMPEGKAAFLKHLSSLDATTRAQTIATLMAGLPPAVQASMNVVGIADAADRLADPQYQAAQAQAIQRKKDWLDNTAKSDPNFKGTPAEWWTDHLATLGVNTLTAFIPAPLRNTLWFAQILTDSQDRLKAEHPDWSKEDVMNHASASSVIQLASQELLARLIGGKFAPITEAITQPFARAGARALTETAIGTTGAGVAQAGANIAEGAPITQGVPQAMLEGAFQGGIPGLVHGVGEFGRQLPRDIERVQREWEEPPVEQPPAEQQQPPGQRRVFSEKFEDRVLLTQDQAHQVLGLQQRLQADPSYELTKEDQALVNAVAETRMLTADDKDAITGGRKSYVWDFIDKVVNDINRHSRIEPRPSVEPIEERLPVEQPPVEERPPAEQPPVEQPPVEDANEKVEQDLNRQNADLDKRYDVEDKLGPPEPPIEEKPVPADITEYERAREQPPERPGEPPGMVPGEVPQEVAPPDVRPQPVHPDVGRPEGGGGADVPGQLGRVPGPLEIQLSPGERAAYQPLVDELNRHPAGSQESQDAHRALLDAIYNSPRFKPIFDAAGVTRNDKLGDFKGIATARIHGDGNLELLLNHPNFEDATRRVADDYGNDPVDYIHRVLQEELLHHGENLVRRDRWQRETTQGKTKEDFVDYSNRQSLGMVNDLVKARDRATAKGNHALAGEITDAIRNSMQMYDRGISEGTADAKFQDLLDRANAGSSKARSGMYQIASELTRQMHQIQHGDPTEASWRSAVQRAVKWYTDAIAGLRQLFMRLGPGQALAKTELAKLIRATQRKLATLTRQAQRATETGTARPGREISESILQAETSLPEAVRRAKAGYGLMFKSGESALLDYDETRNLARAIRRKPSLLQQYGQRARLAQLVRAFDSVPRAERDRVKTEFTDYTRAEQNRQPLPAVGADTMRIINAGKDTMQAQGQIAKELNMHVKDANGAIRPMRLIGRDYYPRMISRDVQDIFNNRDGNRAADFDALVNRQIANGVVKDRQEFIDKFTHAINGDPHSNDHFSNLERGRQLQLPLDFYDHSPEALLRYAQRANERLSQVGAFGQKLSNKGKDMFNLAEDKVNQSGNLSHNAKEAIVRRIADERTAQFNSQQQNGLERMGSAGRNIATGLFLSNQATAFRNLMTGAAQNFVFGGPGSFLKTAAQFPFHWKSMIAEARDRNILRANLRNVMDDYNLVTNPNWLERQASKFGQWGIAFGGHNLTENINRTFGMQQAKEILRLFAHDYGVKDNPITRARNEFIARRFGIRHDEDPTRTLSALAREGGKGPLSDEFLRQYVMDVHANYGPSQSPAHIFNSPVGKALTQFQRWSANTSRMATREYLMPLTRAIKSGSPSEIGYHALRSLGYLAAGAGVMLPTGAILNAIYHRDPKDPTLAEIGKQFQKGDNAQALQWGLAKLGGLIQMSGFTGLFGNTFDVMANTLGMDPSGRLKDPLHPPSFGILEPFLALFAAIKGEGLQRAMQDPKLWDNFASKLSSTYRTGKAAILGTANSAGIKIPWSEAYGAQNTRNFARDRIAMYEAQNPVLQQKAEQKGTQAAFTQMAGRKPFDPTGDRIVNGLLSGHGEDVNSAIREWLSSVPVEQRKAEYDRIKAKINDNSPLKVGGSTKPEAVMGFLDWARGNLPEGEARRIYSLAQTYAKTALSTGMEDKSKGMNALAQLDYDKAQSVRQPNAAAVARQSAVNAAQGRQVMAELVKRQRAAEALRNR